MVVVSFVKLVQMTDSTAAVTSVLEQLLHDVTELCTDSDSLSMLDESEYLRALHPPPCSQDFQFFRAICDTMEEQSPGSKSSLEWSGVSPPWEMVDSPETGETSPSLQWESEDILGTGADPTLSPVFRRRDLGLVSSGGVSLLPLTQVSPSCLGKAIHFRPNLHISTWR